MKNCIICGNNIKFCKNGIHQTNRAKTCGKLSCIKELSSRRQETKIAEKNKIKIKKVKKLYLNNAYIDYLDSPNGEAFIGFAKKPLMPNDNEIGFKGVKIQTSDRKFIQCFECGNWYKALTDSHLKRCANITVEKYRKKFGFNSRTGLVADITSIKFANIGLKNLKKSLKDGKINRDNILNKMNTSYKVCENTMEKMNGYGTCPAQLKDRLITFIHRFKKIPSSVEGFSCRTYALKFGTFNNALKKYGLPIRKQRGYATEYIFPDNSIYIKTPLVNYEELYNLMLKKCKILQDTKPKYYN